MHAGAGGALQFEDGVQRHRLRLHGQPFQPQAFGIGAAGGRRATRQPWVLRPQPQRMAQAAGVAQRAPKHPRVGNAEFALRKGDTAGLRQQRHFGQRFARQSHRHRAQRMDHALPCLRMAHQRFHLGRFVGRRVRVRRQHQAGHAAGQRGTQFGRRQSRGAGLRHPRRQIDQARQHRQSAGVQAAIGLKAIGRVAHGDNLALCDV
ncbi:hypothetical protein D3C87_1596320 [compost metagenome]